VVQARSGSHRVALDGLRGVAASVVVFHHWFNALTLPREQRRMLFEGALAPFVNGQGAVVVFFVLSGTVLAASLARGRGPSDWPLFYTKRVFRIHPPYLFALLFAWAASFFYVRDFGAERGLTHVMWQMAQVHLAPAELLAAMLYPSSASGQLSVGWTLRVEMIFSLLLPLLALAARWRRGIPLLAASLATFAVDYAWGDLWYAIDFAAGIVLFQQRDAVARGLRRMPRPLHALLPALGLAILCAPHLLGWTHAAGGILIAGWDRRDIFVMAPGAALLVACAMSLPGFEGLLSRAPLRFLGRISFSLYLLHLPILNVLAPRIVSPQLPGSPFVLLLALIAVVLPASIACHRWIEVPSIALGNRVCRRWAARRGTAPLESHAADVA
jgi:peptidoglycan/LPS O-acetylase OafA/YrhL